MARQYYKDTTTGQMKPLGVKVEDTLPVDTIVEYNGQNIPEGWVDIGNGKIKKEYQVIPTNAKLENGDSTSATNGYTAEYINDHSVVVSATEPTGADRKKVWKQFGNIFTSDIIRGVVSTNSIDTTSTTRICTEDFIKVEPNKTYILSYDTTASVDNINISYFSSNAFPRTNESGWISNKLITIPSGCNYILITFRNSSNNTIVASDISNIKLEIQNQEYILNNNNVYREYAPQNEIYSTSETRIGTWLGKPLYRKIIDFGALPNNTDKSVALGISNLELIITMNGVANRPGGNKMPIPTVSSTLSGMIYIYIDASLNLHIVTGEDRSSYTKTYITIEYTKTTDD